MGSIFYLKDSDDYIIGVITIDNSDHHAVDGTCKEVTSWYGNKIPDIENAKYLADFYCKWDACTHWNFRGEDYDPLIENCDEDNYYHLCGQRSFTDHIRLMCFVWKVVAMILVRENQKSDFVDNSEYVLKEAYFESDKIKALVEFMLDGYTIEEEE